MAAHLKSQGLGDSDTSNSWLQWIVSSPRHNRSYALQILLGWVAHYGVPVSITMQWSRFIVHAHSRSGSTWYKLSALAFSKPLRTIQRPMGSSERGHRSLKDFTCSPWFPRLVAAASLCEARPSNDAERWYPGFLCWSDLPLPSLPAFGCSANESFGLRKKHLSSPLFFVRPRRWPSWQCHHRQAEICYILPPLLTRSGQMSGSSDSLCRGGKCI